MQHASTAAPQDDGLIVRPLAAIGTSAGWFRDQLRRRQVRFSPASTLSRALNRLDEFRARSLRGDLFRYASLSEAYDFFADAIGADFLTKSVHWGSSSGLTLEDPEWALFCKSIPIVTRPGRSDAARNRTWEFVLASLAATFASDVRLAEPDVTCRLDGRTFAIAAKVAYSTDKVYDRIMEGLRQAEAQRADASLVFVDVVGLYPHEPRYTSDLDSAQVMAFRWSCCRKLAGDATTVTMITDSVTRWCDARFALRDWAAELKKRATRPFGVAFFVPSFVQVRGHPTLFPYTHLPLTWSSDGPDFRFASLFLKACGNVLGFAGGCA